MIGKLHKTIAVLMSALIVTVNAQVSNPDNSKAIERENQVQEEINPASQDENQFDRSNNVVQSNSEQAETEKQNNPSTPDTFTPSEEISEDLSVSFPVDI